jgi:hypothetical protein
VCACFLPSVGVCLRHSFKIKKRKKSIMSTQELRPQNPVLQQFPEQAFVSGQGEAVDQFMEEFNNPDPAVAAAEHAPGHDPEALAAFRATLNPQHEAADAAEALAVDPGFEARSNGERALVETVIDAGRFTLEEDGINPPFRKSLRRWTGLQGTELPSETLTHANATPETDAHGERASEEIAANDTKIGKYLESCDPRELAKFIAEVPAVSQSVSEKIASIVAQTGEERDMWSVLGRFPELGTSDEFLKKHFAHPQELKEILRTKPGVLTEMAKTSYLKGVQMLNAVDIYNAEPDTGRRDRMVHYVDVLNNPNATATAKSIANSILRLGRMYEVGEIPYGGVAHGAVQTYLPDQNKLGSVPVPLASRLPESIRATGDIPEKALMDMSTEEQIMCLKGSFVADHKTADGLIDVSEASLADLKGEFQELVLGERVQRAVEESNSRVLKEKTTQRNIQLAESGKNFIQEDDLIHTSYADVVDTIMQNGLVCGEFRGGVVAADAFPHNVDFYKIDHAAAANPDVVSAVSSRVTDGSVTFILDRSEASQRAYPDRLADVTSNDDNRHRLVLGAVPSTAIKAIVAHKSVDVDALKRSIAQHGMYVPIIDDAGKLLFSPSDYDQARTTTPLPPRLIEKDSYRNAESLTPPWDSPTPDRRSVDILV